MGCGASAAPVNAASDVCLAQNTTSPRDRQLLMTSAEWLAQTHEQVMYPEMKIIDPHHHLFPLAMPPFLLESTTWKNTMFGTGGRTQLDKPYWVQELVADMAYNNVTHTIHVECGQFYDRGKAVPKHLQCVGETKRLQEIYEGSAQIGAGFPRICAGIIAHADLDLDEELVAEQLDAHIAAGKNVCGVRDQAAFAPLRHGSGEEADPGIHCSTEDPNRLRSVKFRSGLAVLQARNLVYDCFLYHPQLSQLTEVADTFPDLTIVCEHAGLPLGICSYSAPNWADGDVAKQWRAEITALAKHRNVFAKLGALTFPAAGFGLDKRQKPIGSEELASVLAPWYNFLIDAFGAERCMFESNFPMDKSSCSYTVLWNAFKRIVKQRACGEGETKDLFGGTAKRVYGLQNV